MSDATLPASMQRIVLRRRPEGLLTWDDVELLEVPLPVPGPGQALLHNEVIAIDASVRSWLSPARGYLPPVELGEVGALLVGGQDRGDEQRAVRPG